MKSQINKFSPNLGQSLISLVVFMVIAIIIISGAVAAIVVNSRTTDKFYQGAVSNTLAEAGIENALLRLLRNPSYTGETLIIGGSVVVIQVSGGGEGPYIIKSQSTYGNFQRAVEVTASYNNNILTATSWRQL